MDTNLKNTLRASGFNFKKKLGQNFISDKSLLAAIADGARITKDDVVVEIGCGAGTLTREIAKRCKKALAYEVDKDLKPVLSATLAGVENVEVIFADFLKADLAALERETGEYKVVANLPYYITTPVIMKIYEQSKLCKSLTVTVQKEVAQRLAARENTHDYGAITAVLAYEYDAEIILSAPREKFFPVPNVDSAVVRLTRREPLEVKSRDGYIKVVRAAFASRRKTLENNLVKSFSLTRERAEEALARVGVDKNARGETLSPRAFAALSDELYGLI